MADGAKNVIGGTFEDIGEAVVKPVADEVGKAIETGVQSVIQGPSAKQTQQKPQESKLEEQKKLAEARRKLDYWKKLEEEQRKVREEQKQKEAQRQQSLNSAQDKQQRQIKQFQIVKKSQELHPAIAAKGKMEIKRGIGG